MAIVSLISAAASAIAAAASAVAAAVGISTGTLASLALGAALSVGGSLLRAASIKSGLSNPAAKYQAVVNQAAASRRRGYGRLQVGGVRAFYDSRNGALQQIVMLHHGEVDGIEALYFSDVSVAFATTADPNVRRFSRGLVGGRVHLGAASQPADPAMLFNFPDVWTADHRLNGICYIQAGMSSPPIEDYLTTYPEGAQTTWTAILRLSRVYDPRTDAVAWSENPALQIADYLTHPDGYRDMTADDIDWDVFAGFANLCDELVTKADATTEPRYRSSLMYDLTDDPADVLPRMLQACDAELYTTSEGKVGIRGGEWTAPTVTIGPEHILTHDLRQGVGALDRYNQLKIVYTDPDIDYQPTECEPWEDLADQAERGVITADFGIDAVPSPAQARRLGKIKYHYDNPEWIGTITTDLYGLLARTTPAPGVVPGEGERGRPTVRLVLPELQIDGPFYVEAHDLLLEQGLPIGCSMTVRSANPAAYSWTTVEEGENPAIPADTSPDLTIAAPEGLSLTVDRRSVTEATIVSVIVATVDASDRDDAALQAEIRLTSSSAWEAMSVASGSLEAVSGALVDGEDYAVRVRWRFTGSASVWSDEESITVVSNPVAPATPTDFSAALSGADVDLEWMNPAANFYRATVWRGATNVFASATLLDELAGVAGAMAAYVDTAPASGTWYYWVSARNESGIPSAVPAGPVSVTVP